MTSPDVYDVIIIGAGPAGSTTAALLARAGLVVAVVERERFPRFHIGESLLPACLPVLEEIGVDLGAGGYLRKQGAEFYDEATGDYGYFAFADALPGPPRFAYQVERAQFDHDLACAAIRAGVQMHFGTTALDYRVDDQMVAIAVGETPVGSGPDEGHTDERTPRPAASPAATMRARFLVDASGRRGLTSRGGRNVTPIDGLGRAAGFVHYDAIESSAWHELSERGDIKVLRIADGWLWAIPLPGQRLSVGAVLRRGPLTANRVLDEVAHSPLLSRLTHNAPVSRPRRIADFSYANPHTFGARWVAIGDAAGFLDPVFSSGVAIALATAKRVAPHLVAAITSSQSDISRQMAALVTTMNCAYRTFFAIAHRFYNSSLLDNLFFIKSPDPHMRAGLISILAGDVWRTDNVFQDTLLLAKRHHLPATPWGE